MRSCKLLNNALLAGLATLLLAAPAWADTKSDMLAAAQTADKRGDVVSAQNAYCALAAMDANMQTPAGTAKEACTTYTEMVKQSQKRWEQNYSDGMAALQKGDFDTAEIKFKNVKGGDRVNDAKKELASIPDLRKQSEQAKQNAAADDTSNRLYQEAVSAYTSNNFSGALVSFAQVNGSKRAEAQDYINKINQYQAKISEAQGDEAAHNYAAATTAYQAAANIKADGPGNPAASVSRMQAMATSAPPVQTASTSNKGAGAIKDEGAKLDEGRLLSDARALLAKKQYAKANALVNRVLGQNYRNTEASQLQKEIIDAGGKAAATNTNEDPYLAGILNNYYLGNYDDAEAGLRTYLVQPTVPKPGLASFYLGATLLTRYYLSGGTDQKLYQEALRRFGEAVGKPGFVAPEKFVSPKIMKVFAAAAQSAKPS